MCLDANRDMTHSEMCQVIWRKVAEFAYMARTEYRLPNNKIADVYYTFRGIRVVVEVKTLLKSSLFEEAYRKYYSECDYLIIAGPPQPLPWQRGEPISINRLNAFSRIGVWEVTWSGIKEVREAESLRAKRPGVRPLHLLASSPCTAIAVPGCTADKIYPDIIVL